MTTRLISFKEYRSNLSCLWKEAMEKNVRYVVTVHSRPVFEVSPIADGDLADLEVIPKLERLPDDQVTPEMLRRARAALKKPLSSFTNL